MCLSVKAAGVLCVLGISFGIGTYVLYKIYDRYIKPVFRRKGSVSSDEEETDEEVEDTCVVCANRTNVVCFTRLLKCLRSLYGKRSGPRSDCSYRSSLFWVHAVCFYTYFVSNVRQLFAADDFSRQHFPMHFSSLRFKG